MMQHANKTGMLPVASPTKCKSCGSVPETDTLQKDFHNKSRTVIRPVFCMVVSFKVSDTGFARMASPYGAMLGCRLRELA